MVAVIKIHKGLNFKIIKILIREEFFKNGFTLPRLKEKLDLDNKKYTQKGIYEALQNFRDLKILSYEKNLKIYYNIRKIRIKNILELEKEKILINFRKKEKELKNLNSLLVNLKEE